MSRSKPEPDEIEVSVFGRGFGESIVIHVGDDRWIVVDSLKEADGRSAAQTYFAEIGVDIEKNVDLIVATHWHDDHVAGISDIYQEAKNARFALTTAMQREEVKAFLRSANHSLSKGITSGVDELRRVSLIRKSRLPAKFAIADRTLFSWAATTLSHGHAVAAISLSPSDADIEAFVASHVETASGGRIMAQGPNDLSVVLWLSLGDQNVLLGADLEVTVDPTRGWTAILASTERPDGVADIFKVSHHGSENAHSDRVWAELLSQPVIACLTTWNRGRKLPTKQGIARILSKTNNAHVTSALTKSGQKQSSYVRGMMRTNGIKTKSLPDRCGHVRMRFRVGQSVNWLVEYFHGAISLQDFEARI